MKLASIMAQTFETSTRMQANCRACLYKNGKMRAQHVLPYQPGGAEFHNVWTVAVWNIMSTSPNAFTTQGAG